MLDKVFSMSIASLVRRVLVAACFVNGVSASERPNFLFILTDDQAPHTLGAYGNQVCQTPNIDRIARDGMLFHDAHHMGSWHGAVCLPSRTMIMTGRSLWDIPGPRRDLSPEFQNAGLTEVIRTSMPALFRAAGYDTFRTCKIGSTFEPVNKVFQTDFDDADKVQRYRDWCKRDGDDIFGSAWHADRVVEFLQGRAVSNDTDDPFLIYLGFSHPHDPRHGKPELLEKYGAVDTDAPPTEVNPAAPPLQVNYLPAHPFHHGHPDLRDEVGVTGVLTERSEAAIRDQLGREYACIENIDIQVGRVVDKLEEVGELDNTYIIFTADHGIAVGRHGLMGKQNLYEPSWRVPFLVSGPGIKPGSEASGYIYLMDVLPTLCDLAGIEIPEELDGTSFRPVLEGRQDRIRDVMYGVYCGGTLPGMRCVKSDGWKLIKYDVLDGKVRETQLFNLRENPNELLLEHQAADVIALTGNTPSAKQVDLAEDPEFASKRRELEELLVEEQERWHDPYRLWDQTSFDSIKQNSP